MLSKVSTTLGLSSASMAASDSEFSISSSSKSPSPGAVSPPSPSSPLARSGAPLNGVAPAGAAGGAGVCASQGKDSAKVLAAHDGFCWDRSGLYFAGYFIWERTNYEPRGIERRPHQAKALGHLDLAIQFASPGTANSATAPRLGLARADFLSQYRSAQQRRFPEPLVREIEERFGDCLDTDHSAGRGNGMSGIVAGKQPNEAERVHRGERAPRRGLDCRPNVRAEPHR